MSENKSDACSSSIDSMMESENKVNSNRIELLENKVQAQSDEIACLKSALADCLRRIQSLELQAQQKQILAAKPQSAPAPKQSKTSPRTESLNNSVLVNKKQLLKNTPKTSSADTLLLTKNQLIELTKDQVQYNRDIGLLKFYIRGRPIQLYLSSKFSSYDPNLAQTKPSESLKLEWVHGYRGKDCRTNLHLLSTGEVVYFIASVAVLYNIDEHSQRFYLGHTDDIKSIAIHPNRVLVATGQTAGHDKQEGKPHVRVWDSTNLTTIKIIGLSGPDFFHNSISCLSFSKSDNGDLLAVVDESNERILSIWNWSNGIKVTSTKCHGDTVLNCEFHPLDKNLIITTGKQHLTCWSNTDAPNKYILHKKNLTFDSLVDQKPKFILCLQFLNNGDFLTGDTDGNLIHWDLKTVKIRQMFKNVHESGLFSILVYNDLIVTGGKDGKLIEWDLNFKKTGHEFKIPDSGGSPRCMIGLNENYFLIGTTKNCVYQANFDLNYFKCLINSHFDELWGLSKSMTNDAYFLTCGNDKNLCYWDTTSRRMIWSVQLDDKLHCVNAHPNLDLAAIGYSKSKWIVYDLMEKKLVHIQAEGTEQIECIKYSPNGLYLACGSRDNNLYVYSVSEDGLKYSRMFKLTGHSSFITHLDWSMNNEYLMSNSGDYEVLYWHVLSGKQITQIQIIRELEWSFGTCVLSSTTLGIWSSPNLDGTDINSCCVSNNKRLLVSVDDFGKVNLFKYPALNYKTDKKSFNGHSSHVTNCSFLSSDSRLITTGGNDMAIFQWLVLDQE